ncbi:MAG TPA: DUF3293 domain-containing protein [Burkholderiaceae bacterium]|nr:DUF3293 domain-containing protein [Burkholderiaceae bacterium]
MHGGLELVLRIGRFSSQLETAHRNHGVSCSAFITAWNPYSQLTDAATNTTKQRALAKDLEQEGLTMFPGIGIHPSNQWPGEESFFVLGLTLNAAKQLGIAFQQNAIVWAGADAIPQLIMLPDTRRPV